MPWARAQLCCVYRGVEPQCASDQLLLGLEGFHEPDGHPIALANR